MNNYYYELRYVDGEHSVVHKFPADINLEELKDYIADFLKGCSWYESQLKDIFKEEE